MRSLLHVPPASHEILLTRNQVFGRVLTTTLALCGTVWLGIVITMGGLKPSLFPTPEGPLHPAVAGMLTQNVAGGMPIKIDIEAYNKKREKDIAEASKKLLSLASELKSELNGNTGTIPSREAMKKAKEIEKLARKVKESMKISMVGPM